MAQSDILRQWREAKGKTLEAAADAIDILATAAGVDRASKKVPRTHASLSRWETGKVEVKELGLRFIAQAYGITIDQIRRPPPEANAPPRRQIEVAEDQADAVQAFLEALNRKAS